MDQNQTSGNNDEAKAEKKKIWPTLQLTDLGLVQDTENFTPSPPINDGNTDST